MNKKDWVGFLMEKYQRIKKEFEKWGNQENAVKMARYMRNQFCFYGLSALKRKEIYKEFLKEEKKSKVIDWDFFDKCYADEHREFQYLVCDYLLTMHDFVCFEDVLKIQHYIQTKEWWDTIDSLDRVIGNLGLKDERINDLMLAWADEEDIWLRRIAIDHQLGRKMRTNERLLERILIKNLGSKEFFINKAIGWALRDYSRTNPEWVREFIQKYGEDMSTLSVKEASKYLDEHIRNR